MMLGFTGTRGTGGYAGRLQNYYGDAATVAWLEQYDGFVTGGCRGFDTFMGFHAALTFPDKRHVVIVPANQSQVQPWWMGLNNPNIEVYYMPEGTDYRDRNTEIVKRSDFLYYCAEHPEDHTKSKRSGTWMTVRIAQQLGVPYDGIVLTEELD